MNGTTGKRVNVQLNVEEGHESTQDMKKIKNQMEEKNAQDYQTLPKLVILNTVQVIA